MTLVEIGIIRKSSWNLAFGFYQVTHSVLFSTPFTCHLLSVKVLLRALLLSHQAQLSKTTKVGKPKTWHDASAVTFIFGWSHETSTPDIREEWRCSWIETRQLPFQIYPTTVNDSHDHYPEGGNPSLNLFFNFKLAWLCQTDSLYRGN